MHTRRHRPLASILLACLILIGSVVSAAAQDGGSPGAPEGLDVLFGVYPEGGVEGEYFEAEIAPAQSQEFSLALLNAGQERLSLRTYPADVHTMTNGGMGVGFQDQGRTGQTTWLSFPDGVVDVEPGQEMRMPFRVTVPDGVSAGQYVTAIAVETANAIAVGDGGTFSQVLRKVIAVSVIVPGPIEPGFALGAPQLEIVEGNSVLQIPVENTGNIRVRPAGTVRLLDSSGGELAAGDVAMGSVYAGTSTFYELWVPVALPEGEYRVSADLADPDTGSTATLDQAPVSLALPDPTPTPEAAVLDTPEPAVVMPVTLQSASIEPNAEDIQFANISLTLANAGSHVSRSRVTLLVSRDGEVVEEFVLDDNLPLPEGTTTIDDRYIPPTGWESGTWTFTIVIHAINANADVETLLVDSADIATIEVP